jgi:hypothetical protein
MSSIGSDQPSMSSAARLFDSLGEDQYGKILLDKEERYLIDCFTFLSTFL